MKILITGFDPFYEDVINPSIEAVKKLPDEIKGATIIKRQIPTVYKKSLYLLEDIIEKELPDVVINVGQAGGRSDITIERIGINIDDFRIKDNEQNQIIDEKIVQDGDDAYFTTIPIKAILKKLTDNKIPASISNTAGTFICNHVCYYMAYLSKTKYKHMKTGFIHIPYIPEQVIGKSLPSMNIDDIVQALKLTIQAIIENKNDIKIQAGTIC